MLRDGVGGGRIGLSPIVGAFAAGLVLEDSHSAAFAARGEQSLRERSSPGGRRAHVDRQRAYSDRRVMKRGGSPRKRRVLAATVGALAVLAAPPSLGVAWSEPGDARVTVALEPGAGVASDPWLRLTLRAPGRARYSAGALRGEPTPVALAIENAGAHAAALGAVQLSFSAVRDGVPFPCGVFPDEAHPAREPPSLAPGASFTFERRIDCALSLPGTYTVTVLLHAASEGARAAHAIGSFPLVVEGDHGLPQPYPGRPGLFVVLTGPNATEPWQPDDPAHNAYRVVVAAINGGPAPVDVGPADIAFAFFPQGTTVASSGQTEVVALPNRVEPGTVAVTRVTLKSAPADSGLFDVVGRLKLQAAEADVEIGRFVLEVAHDPLRYTPIPHLYAPPVHRAPTP